MKGHLDGVALQNDVNIIVNWINSTGLKLNPTKTRLMVLSRKPHPAQPHIVVAGSPVMQVTSLGVTVSSNLSWTSILTTHAPEPGNNWACSTDISTLPAGRRFLDSIRLLYSPCLTTVPVSGTLTRPLSVTNSKRYKSSPPS